MNIVLPRFLRLFCRESVLEPAFAKATRAESARWLLAALSTCFLLSGFLGLPALAEQSVDPNREDAGQRLPQLDMDSAPMAKVIPAPESDPQFESGVKAYRDGDYAQAVKTFEGLHRQAPENTKYTYYLAIAEAQLGRFQQARRHYSEIVTLEPNGETANLAKEGLKYLPPASNLDLPPRFSKQPQPSGGVGQAVQTAGDASGAGATGSQAASAPGGMSAQDLMAWQMLMGQGSGGNMGGNNPMGGFMPNMMTGMPNGANGMSGMDPNIMSTMLMNQMMQNMNLSGEQGDHR
jgi:tetratricopeptide (TPR) repeat protein